MSKEITIGVISDTHLRSPDRRLRDCAERYFKEVDLIVHCGDITSLSVIEYLKNIAPVKAVYGNMDPQEVREALVEREIVELEGGVKIGVIHGWGAPFGLAKKVVEVFKNEGVSAVFFGHSHIPYCEVIEGIFTFNPGAFTRSWISRRSTVGIVRVKGGEFEGEHLEVNF